MRKYARKRECQVKIDKRIPPALVIRPLVGANLVELSWPTTTGFSLQRADSLSATRIWTTPSLVSSRLTNGLRIVTVTNAVPNRFFRLYKP
jgi:hypothetical protein